MSARTILKHLYEEGRMTHAQYEKIDRNLKEPQWIPCSERLPEPNELVVASLKTGVQLCEYLADGSSDPWLSLTDKCFVYNRLIKAWMPLPKPYREEGEENEVYN